MKLLRLFVNTGFRLTELVVTSRLPSGSSLDRPKVNATLGIHVFNDCSQPFTGFLLCQGFLGALSKSEATVPPVH